MGLFDRFRGGDRGADVWILLSDTDRFLSRARLMPRYEDKVRQWRQVLQEHRGDPEVVRRIRQDIVDFRREMRQQGWELRLGSLDVAVRGFRSDDSMAQGFRRLVLLIGADGTLHATTGSANHLILEEELQARLRQAGLTGAAEPHYLWYRRAEGVLELAGADSEPRDSLERFRVWAEDNKSNLVRVLGRS